MISPWDVDVSDEFNVAVGTDEILLTPKKPFVMDPCSGLTITLPLGYTIVKEEEG